jgi:hypothetical protein
MTLLTRSTLKNLFKRGSVPTEVNFSDFIDSTVNKVDDGFAQSEEYGFMLSPQGSNKELISFFDNMRDPSSTFSIAMSPDRHNKGISLNNKDNESVMFLGESTYVGIGTTAPAFKLEVGGIVGMQGRIGTFATGTVKADGEWHTIVDNLEGINAFEVVAQAGAKEGRGRYAFTYAQVFNLFGSGNVKQVRNTYNRFRGFIFDRISFRWDFNEETGTYRLQVKTAQSYGNIDDAETKPALIKFYVTKLWDDSVAAKMKG